MASSKPSVPENLQHLIAQFVAFCQHEALLLDGVDLKKTRLTAKKGILRVQLPYMDRHGRPLQLEVMPQQDRWRLSEGGRILTECQGMRCRPYLRQAQQWYGCTRHHGALIVETAAPGFAGPLQTFIRVLRALDYFMASQTTQAA